MKTSIKPSLLILFSFMLSFVNTTLPATKIQYQRLANASQSTTSLPTIVKKEGFEGVVPDDKYGREAIPCLNPTLESLPNAGFVTLRFIWRLIAFGLTLTPFFLAADYAVTRKISLRAFFAWVVTTFGMLVLVVWAAETIHPEPVQQLCNFDDRYRILSFTPHWLFIPLPTVATLLAYFGTRHAPKNEYADVTATR